MSLRKFARRTHPGFRVLALLLALGAPAQAAAPQERAPEAAACPREVPAETRCFGGRDSAGAFYLIAMPADWNGVLVMHAHGGPTLGKPSPKRAHDDLVRWAIMPRAGYAWAASTFRQGGVEVRAAAEDTERLRRIFVEHVAKPKITILHGQSWGASVAAKGAEIYGAGGKKSSPYQGVLLTSGVLGGGTRSYDFRLDLRVVYQYLCGNHPRPEEPQYPLWMGLPLDSKLTRKELAQRADACLGLRTPAESRTPEQQAKLKTIVDVIRIPERSVLGHLNWGTWHFQDIAQRRAGGRSVFGNEGVRYAGSPDDRALNAGVLRYRADPDARARFGEDTDPTGRIPVPVLTAHAIGDPIAFVELESAFRETMERAGTSGHLVQAFTDHTEHSYLDHAVYPALMAALLHWVQTGEKPAASDVARRCSELEAKFGEGCRFVPDYRPPPLETRVAPRGR